MIDPFVLLAPILLLGVIALVGFVGCAQVIGVDDWDPRESPTPLPAPTNVHATSGDSVVTLFWDPYPNAILYEIDRKESPQGIPPASYDLLDNVSPAELTTINGFLAYEDHTVMNGLTYHYVIRATTSDGTTDFSPDIEATPSSPFSPFVTSFTAGTIVTPGTGWNGMAIQIGMVGITVQKLGRSSELGMSNTHQLRLVDGATNADIGTTTVDMQSETLEKFAYGSLQPGGVKLEPGGLYYVLSEEMDGGDQIYDQDTIVTVRDEATVPSAVYSTAPSLFVQVNSEGHAYGPVNIQY